MDRYPGTGHIIVHVIPPEWGPFVDIRACYQSLARRRPWTHVISPAEYHERINGWLWNDPDTVFVCWTMMDPGPKWQRKCKVVTVYSEALDDDGAKLLHGHLDHWNNFRIMSVHFDAVATHTPMTAEIVARAGCPTFVMPVGWDPDAMGRPRRDAPKLHKFLYHGSCVGRRELVIPYLRANLGNDHFLDGTGMFGRSLLGTLDTADASLYIAHSEVASFSTWRLWQTASTTAAMVAEPGDTWPFEIGKHYVGIQRVTMLNAPQTVRDLAELVKRRDLLLEVATRAYEEVACRYTVDHIEDAYLVPALCKL